MTVTDPTTYALVARLHGIFGGLALALLLHPVLNLRGARARSRWTRFTAELGAAFLAAPFTIGWVIYPTYRHRVKPALLAAQPYVALRFETKEHFAAMAVALAVGGALTLRFAGHTDDGRRAAWALLTCAWVLGAAAACIGVWVGGHAHPGWGPVATSGW